MGGLGVALDLWFPLEPHLVEENPSRRFVDGEQPPLLHAIIAGGSNITSDLHIQFLHPPGDRGGQIDPIAPDNGGSMPKALDPGLPTHIFLFSHVPADGQSSSCQESTRTVTPELGPLSRRGQSRGG